MADAPRHTIKTDPEEAEARLADYLRGAARHNKQYVENMLKINNWQALANRRLEQEATRIINTIDTDTLIAIAQGGVSVNYVASKVLEEIEMSE